MAEREKLRSFRGDELTASQLHDVLRVRIEIFVVEQNCPYLELDGPDLDPGTVHLWIEDEEGIAAYLRILDDAAGRRIGRVLTRPNRRRTGVSTKLMTAALDLVGGTVTVLDAQAHLTDYYRRFGYEPNGPEFIEDGIPHVPMRRRPHG